MALRQAYSVGSTRSSLNLAIISWKHLISVINVTSLSELQLNVVAVDVDVVPSLGELDDVDDSLESQVRLVVSRALVPGLVVRPAEASSEFSSSGSMNWAALRTNSSRHPSSSSTSYSVE